MPENGTAIYFEDLMWQYPALAASLMRLPKLPTDLQPTLGSLMRALHARGRLHGFSAPRCGIDQKTFCHLVGSQQRIAAQFKAR